jgi:adenosine deaminase
MNPTATALMQLPKAELHLHIEGTLEPGLVFELAARNGMELPWADAAELADRYRFSDLQSFLDLYYECMAVLRTAEDFADLARAYFARAAAQGVRHAELFFDPQAHTARGVPYGTVISGLTAAVQEAWRDHGISGGIILCFLRDKPVDEALRVWDVAKDHIGKIIGVGLDSAEVGNPPGRFAAIFREAKSLGLRAVAHAGEEGPPSYIWEALDVLKVDRIDHGIRAVEDGALMDRLVSLGVPLTVCPLSNVKLRAVADLVAHPLLAMLEKGLHVTVNSDDPAYFGGYAGDNFIELCSAQGFDATVAARLAVNSVTGSFAADERKASLIRDIREWEEQNA